MGLVSPFIVACVSLTIIDKITRTETTNRNILGFISLHHAKILLSPEDLVDSVIQSSNNWGLEKRLLRFEFLVFKDCDVMSKKC